MYRHPSLLINREHQEKNVEMPFSRCMQNQEVFRSVILEGCKNVVEPVGESRLVSNGVWEDIPSIYERKKPISIVGL